MLNHIRGDVPASVVSRACTRARFCSRCCHLHWHIFLVRSSMPMRRRTSRPIVPAHCLVKLKTLPSAFSMSGNDAGCTRVLLTLVVSARRLRVKFWKSSDQVPCKYRESSREELLIWLRLENFTGVTQSAEKGTIQRSVVKNGEKIKEELVKGKG